MRNLHIAPLQAVAVSAALLRGTLEFAALQRWRLKAWLAR
jgi:hypothetical protein